MVKRRERVRIRQEGLIVYTSPIPLLRYWASLVYATGRDTRGNSGTSGLPYVNPSSTSTKPSLRSNGAGRQQPQTALGDIPYNGRVEG